MTANAEIIAELRRVLNERDEARRERDEARAETARLRRLLNMAEDELVAADDHGRREAKRADNVEAEVEALKAERDEAQEYVRVFCMAIKLCADERDYWKAKAEEAKQ